MKNSLKKKTIKKKAISSKKIAPSISITDCTFAGVKWDGLGVETLRVLVDTQLKMASTQDKIADLFRGQNVTFNSLVTVEEPKIISRNKAS